MKHNYFTKAQALRKTILMLGLSGIAAMAGAQQMNGTVYIDPNGTASTTVFKNWYSFWRSLQGQTRTDGGPNFTVAPFGVSGNLTVEVMASNTVAETVAMDLPATIGSDVNKKITINGNGNTMLYSGANAAIRFTGANNVTINKLVIQNNNSTPGGIWFNNQSDSNTINGCSIFLSNLTTANSSTYYINMSTSVSSPTSTGSVATGSTGQPGSYNTITGCNFYTQSGSPGPYYAVTMNGNTANYTSVAQNNTLQNCTFGNFNYMAVYMNYPNGNHVLYNDISRANATSGGQTQLYGIYSYYPYGTNRQSIIQGNNIHDLPFVGASITNTNLSSYYMTYLWYPNGTAARPFKMDGNTFKNIYASTSTQYTNYIYYPTAIEITNNMIDNIQSSGTSATWYNWYIYYPSGVRFNNNTVQNCISNYYLYNYYIYYTQNGSFTWNEFIGNKTLNNRAVNYMYTYIYYYNGTNNWKYNNNMWIGNRVTGSTGYFYNYFYYPYSYEFNNNIFADNYANSHYYYLYSAISGSYTAEIRNNTIQADMSSVPTPGSSYLYCYFYAYYHTDVRFTGNVWDLKGGSSGTLPYYRYIAQYLAYSTPANLKEFNYNTYYLTGGFQYPYWYFNGSNYTDWAGFSGAGVNGPNDNGANPKWVNPSIDDFRPGAWELQNNVPYKTSTNSDAMGVLRNKVRHDRGGLENMTDIEAAGTNFSVPDTVCAGYSTGATSFTVKSNYIYDQAYGFDVSYSVNGGPKISQKVNKKLSAGDTAKVWFSQPLTLNAYGTNRVTIFVDMPDDKNDNDTLVFTTFVKPAPGGGKFTFSTKPTVAFYQYTKSNDITVLKAPVIYNSVAPRIYNNASYNSAWIASAYAITSGGNLRPGSEVTYTAPSGSNDLEVKFQTNDPNMEDSLIWVCLKVTDLSNGCDTLIRRQVLIYPTVVTNFSFPASICDGDAVQFENKSKVRSGSMEFLWDFGTGKSSDVSEIPEPTFTFPTSGTYKVRLLAKTLPYGFPTYDSAMVTVKVKPKATFTHTNACAGYNLTFNNAGTTAGAALNWKFGDNSTSTSANPVKKYTNHGAYMVTLTATQGGCSDVMTKRVYQFPAPKAIWTKVNGTCDNDQFTFKNSSTIATGEVGSYWNFDDGTISAEQEPVHTFSSSGDKMVKLIAISEFGCKDSMITKVTVNESPKTNFSFDKTCSLSPTQFSNSTPTVAGPGGAVKVYRWNFSDGSVNGNENTTKTWTSVGPKTVTYYIELMNSCKSSITKDINVGVEPNAGFTAPDVCEGQPVIFQNKTQWAEGNISYLWNFGDGTTSTDANPTHTYANPFAPNVTLYASIAGGCSDSVVIPVNVFEGPKTCNFSATPDYASSYYGIRLQSLDKNGAAMVQPGVTYTWVIQGQGNRTGGNITHDLRKDGAYEVTMNARIDATGCQCSKTMSVVMNRAAARTFESTGMALFPNPNNGQFTIALKENFGKEVTVSITGMTGTLIRSFNATNNGSIPVNTGDIADGVYLVRVQSGDNVAVQRITVRR